MRKNSEIEEEIGEASSEADDEAEDAQQIFKCLPEIGRPGRVLAQAYKVNHLCRNYPSDWHKTDVAIVCTVCT